MQTFSRGQHCWGSNANGRNFATSASIVVVPCKRMQQVSTLLGPTMLGVAIVGQQCCVRLHGVALGCVHNVWQRGGEVKLRGDRGKYFQ